MFKVLVTEEVIAEGLEKLKAFADVDIAKRGDFDTEEDFLNCIHKYDGILSMLSNPISEKVLAKAERLKVIANNAVGYNNIDIKATSNKGIVVTNTPDVLTNATADGTFALLLATVRHIPASVNFLHEGKFDGWHPTTFLGMELNGATLGIVGMGRIGQAVAKRAAAFGLNIIYHNRNKIADTELDGFSATYVDSVKDLAKSSDIIVLLCPLTAETQHLINQEILDIMPSHAFIINASRGAVIDEAALANALHQGAIAGAGLDVFEFEPKIHPDLLTAPNTVLTPHIASATYKTRATMVHMCSDAIIHVLSGKDAYELNNRVV